nr:MAG TPA: hypothetical protein [Caudoviricetes sp.]
MSQAKKDRLSLARQEQLNKQVRGSLLLFLR